MARSVLWLLLALTIAASGIGAQAAEEPAHPVVVVINSYHPSFLWTSQVRQGLINRLRQDYPDLEPYEEYLDWKRCPSTENLDSIGQSLSTKYQDKRIDVVVTSDNAALDFAVIHQQAIFGGAPIVFCGLAGYREMADRLPANCTGVCEAVDPEATLNTMLAIHPDTSTIVVIHDRTETGLARHQEFQRIIARRQDNVQFRCLANEGLDLPQMLDALKQLPPKSLVFSFTYTNDSNGESYTTEEATELTTAASPVPVYHCWEMALGHGIVGGNLLSGDLHGRTTAELVLRILHGEDPTAIQVIEQADCPPMFDEVVLQRFKIPQNRLPAGCRIINRPDSFIARYKFEVLLTIILIVVLAAGNVILVANSQLRKKAESKLRKSEQFLQAVVEASPLGISVRSRTGRLLSYNPAWQVIWAIPDEVIQEDMQRERVDLALDARDDYSKPWWQQIKRVYQEGGTLFIPEAKTLGKRPGSAEWVAQYFYAISDAAGNVDRVVVITQDVTERKRSEQALRHSEERFRLLTENARDLIFRIALEPEQHFEYISPSALAITGYSAEEHYADPQLGIELVYPDDRPRFARSISDEGFADQPVVIRWLKKDGSLVWTEQYLTRIYNQAGQLVAIEGIARDITERIKAEQMLAHERDLLHAFLDSTPDTVYFKDCASRFTRINRAQASLLGLSDPDLAVGKSDADFFTPEHAAAAVQDEQQVMATGKPLAGKVELVETKSGQQRWMSTTKLPYLGRDGVIAGTIGLSRDISSIIDAETALRQSETRYRTLVDHMSEGLTMTDANVRYVYANPAAERIFGVEPGGLIGRRLHDFVPDEQLTFLEQEVQRRKLRIAEPYEIVLKQPNGGLRHVWVVPSIRTDEHGTYIGSQAIVLDITDRKLAEQALRDSEERFRLAAQATGQLVYDYDIPSGQISWAGAIAECLGYTHEEFAVFDLERWKAEIHPDDQAKAIARLDQALAELTPYHVEYRFRRKDGSFICFEDWARILPDSHGRPLRMIGSMKDITQRMQGQRALIESESRLQSMVENLPFDFWACDTTGRCILQNPSCVEHWGDQVGQKLDESNLDPRIMGFLGEMIPRALSGQVVETLRENIQQQGTQYLRILVAPIHAGDRVIGMLGINLDITEQRRAEVERRQLEDRLRQAQKMEALGTLAGGIAHDFNNILFAIMGYAELVREDLEPDTTVSSHLTLLINAAQRAKSLIQQILTFSRKAQVEPVPLYLSTIAKEVVKFLKATLPSSIEIRQQIEAQHAMVLADPTEMHQVLMNLCTNAAQAMENQTGVLEIGLREILVDDNFAVIHPGLTPGLHVELQVSDSGVGMAAAVRERIFEPFFTTKGPGLGTGMGLAVVHGVVTKLGGAVGVYSEVGRGTTFKVYLPAQRGEMAIECGDTTPLPRGTEHILVVDDEPDIVAVLEQALGHLGYRVTACTGSLRALELFQQDPTAFDLVLSDQTMPSMTGAVLAASLLRIRPDLPVIICTGYSTTISPESAKELGIAEFLFKPVPKTELAEAIRRTLDRARTS